jgi:hypothetical protein
VWGGDLCSIADLAWGVLGFFCSNAYAHSSRPAAEGLPRRLKGSDLVLYSVFKALGIETSVLPVIERHGWYIDTNPRLESDDDDDDDDEAGCNRTDRYESEGEEDYEQLTGPIDIRYNSVPINTVLDAYFSRHVPYREFAIREHHNEGFPYSDDVDSRWKVLVLKQRICGLSNFVYRARGEGFDVTGLSYRNNGARVGSSLYEYKAHDQLADEEDDDKVRAASLFLANSTRSELNVLDCP